MVVEVMSSSKGLERSLSGLQGDVVLGQKAMLDPLGVAAVGAHDAFRVAESDEDVVTPVGDDGDAVEGHE